MSLWGRFLSLWTLGLRTSILYWLLARDNPWHLSLSSIAPCLKENKPRSQLKDEESDRKEKDTDEICHSLYNLILEVTSHHFCCIWSFEANVGPVHIKGRELFKGWKTKRHRSLPIILEADHNIDHQEFLQEIQSNWQSYSVGMV